MSSHKSVWVGVPNAAGSTDKGVIWRGARISVLQHGRRQGQQRRRNRPANGALHVENQQTECY